jgi:hypothetical protein
MEQPDRPSEGSVKLPRLRGSGTVRPGVARGSRCPKAVTNHGSIGIEVVAASLTNWSPDAAFDAAALSKRAGRHVRRG